MVIMQQMIVLFIMMVIGFIAYKKDIITNETSKKLSSIVVNISNPALILSSVVGGEYDQGQRACTDGLHSSYFILAAYDDFYVYTQDT